MIHGLRNDFLYLALKIDVEFINSKSDTAKMEGTAFIVKNKKGELCLITNRHVVDLSYKKTEAKWADFKCNEIVIHCKEMDEKGLPSNDHLLLVGNPEDFKFPINYQNDVACLKNFMVKSFDGSEPKINYNLDFKDIATKNELISQISICDQIAFPGFPTWHDHRNKLAIFRTGTIASDPRFNYSYNGEDNGEVLAYEGFSFAGSSGSPVFAIQKGIKISSDSLNISGGDFRRVMLIGVNAGHLPEKGVIDTHSGISFFYKSSVILELID